MRIWLPAVLVLLACATAHAAPGQQGTPAPVQNPRKSPDFLFGRPDGSIGIRGNWVFSRAGSDWYDFVTKQLTVERGDFNGPELAFDVGFTVAGAEQPDQRVRSVEVVLDLVDQRPDADDLGPQRQRGEEEAGEGRSGGAAASQRAAAPAVFARCRAMRANSSTCRRASRPAGPGFTARIASRIGTCFSAASCGSTYVP